MASVVVGVVHEHPVIQAGLRAVLEDAGFAAVCPGQPRRWASRGGRVLVCAVESHEQVDLVVELAIENPSLRVVALADVSRADMLTLLLATGVCAVVSHDPDDSELVRAVHDVVNGQVTLPLGAARVLASAARPLVVEARLTPPQVRLLALLVAGCADEAIAEQVGVSVRTVQRRKTMLFTAMGVRNSLEAVAVAGQAAGHEGD